MKRKEKLKNDHGENRQEDVKPFVPGTSSIPEFTVKAIFVGIILCIAMTFSNAYLGMKAGMTVSASIPAAVISMSVFYGLRKLGMNTSILENNIVQTITSAGESLAAGVIFTVVGVIFLDGEIELIPTTIVALLGGILGVLFMIPMRHYLVVKEHDKLVYPEGTACAEVLKTGEKGGRGASLIFFSLIFGFVYTWLYKGFGLFHERFKWSIPLTSEKGFVFGGEFTPALVGVGYIIGPRISALVFGGGILAWVIIIPLLMYMGFGEGATVLERSDFIHDQYIRYIGAGIMLVGGIFTLFQMRKTIFSSLQSVGKEFRGRSASKDRLSDDLPMNMVVIGVIACAVLIAVIPTIKVGFLGAVISVIAAFLFVAVSAYLVGIVGSSSNPISGMTLATILVAALIMRYGGDVTDPAVVLMTAAVVCIAAATAGDTAQDLKTGFLLGATPKYQQYAQIIGVVASAFVVGVAVVLFHKAYGIGPDGQLPAPQAGMMAEISKGVLTMEARWDFIAVGGIMAVILAALRIPVLPFAVGVYLPVTLGTPIMLGGVIKWLMDRAAADEYRRSNLYYRGSIVSAGLIAGEAIAGVVLAGFMLRWDRFLEKIKVPITDVFLTVIGLLALAAMICFIVLLSWIEPRQKER